MTNLTPAHRAANGRAVFHPAHDAIFVHEAATGAILGVNRKISQIDGYTRDEALQLTPEDLSAGVAPQTPERALELVREAGAGTAPLLAWLGQV